MAKKTELMANDVGAASVQIAMRACMFGHQESDHPCRRELSRGRLSTFQSALISRPMNVAPRLLERFFCNFENHLLNQFSDTHRETYLAGELDARVAIGRWKTSCRVATGKQMMIIGEPGSGKSHLRASSISTAKDATLKSWHS